MLDYVGGGFGLPRIGGRRRGNALSTYAAAGFKPDLVFDFEQEYYRTSGTQTTFDSAISHSRSGNATMVDSDGLLKWAPHNLLTYSEDVDASFATKQGVSVASGDNLAPDGSNTADRVEQDASTGFHRLAKTGFSANHANTFSAWLKADEVTTVALAIFDGSTFTARVIFDLSAGVINTTQDGSGAITDAGNGWYLCEVFSSSGSASSTLYVYSGTTVTFQGVTGDGFYIWGAHVYRSDLGGMVNNPDRGDSYVSTTSAARYLARRGHHVYNGSSWVNEGLLVEPSAATNLITYSEDFTDASWQLDAQSENITRTANSAVGPDGVANSATKLTLNAGKSATLAYIAAGPFTYSNPYTISAYMKAGEYSYGVMNTGTYAGGFYAIFDLLNGVVVTAPADPETSAKIEDCGNGWFRCSITTTDANGLELCLLSCSPENNIVTTGIGGEGIYVYGAQFEQSSVPSSYIPTSGSTVTRAADDADSDNLTYDSSAMWFTLSGLQTFADEGAAGQEVLFDWRADANNRITVTIDTDGAETGEITLTVVSGGTTWSVAQDYLSPGVNVPFNIAWRVTDTEINVAAGGTSATAVATTSIPDLSSASAAFDGNGVYSLFRQGIGDIGDSGIAEASA